MTSINGLLNVISCVAMIIVVACAPMAARKDYITQQVSNPHLPSSAADCRTVETCMAYCDHYYPTSYWTMIDEMDDVKEVGTGLLDAKLFMCYCGEGTR